MVTVLTGREPLHRHVLTIDPRGRGPVTLTNWGLGTSHRELRVAVHGA